MRIHLNSKTFSIHENNAIYEELAFIKFPLSGGERQQLIILFTNTVDARIRDRIAVIFADMADIELVPIILKKIDEIRNSGHISTLIYAWVISCKNGHTSAAQALKKRVSFRVSFMCQQIGAKAGKNEKI